MHDIPRIASEIGRQFAELSRAVARAEAEHRPAASGSLQPPFGNLDLPDWVRAMDLWRQHGAALIAGQPSRLCPACASAQQRFLFYSFDAYPYVDCLDCGTWYVPLVVDDQFFERYYEICPEARTVVDRLGGQRLDEAKAEVDRARFTTYLAELEALVPPGHRDLLDVGCGVGHSLEVAATRGWRAVGVESSPGLLAAGRRRGLTIVHPDEPLPSTAFGLVSLWETLEHLNDPFTLLSQYVSQLRPDGLLVITVPNALAVEARIMRQDLAWINGGAIGTVHINLFHEASLERLLSRVGMTIIGADGEFGFNARELASYFLGRHRGAWEYARGVKVEQSLSDQTICFLNWVGPAWAVLMRQLRLTPIIKVIATKSSDPDAVERLRSIYGTARRAEMLADLDRAYPQGS